MPETPYYVEYANPYLYNMAVRKLLDDNPQRPVNKWSSKELEFMANYTGMGGLAEFGTEPMGVELLYEYYTPNEIIKKMWGLAYKYGYKDGSVMEPSCGTGRFFKYAPPKAELVGYEMDRYSSRICSILFPQAVIINDRFEKVFIKDNESIKGKTESLVKYDLVIGNPPYGKVGGRYMGMGEQSYSNAENYADYFIFRGLDITKTGGLLVFIIGAEVAAGGIPFLDKGWTKIKKAISEKSEILDCYRLPNGIFETTDVLTDIIVLQKK